MKDKKEKIKIVFLSHLDLNLYLFRLPIMQEIVRRGHRVIALCPVGECFHKFKEHGIEAIDYKIERGSLNPFLEINTVIHLYQKLREIKPNLIHTFTHKPNIYGTFAAQLAGVKNILNLVEGLGSIYLSDKPHIKIIRYLLEYFYKIVFNISDLCVFVNSDDPFYFMKKKVISPKKVKIIKSVGVNTKDFVPIPKDKELIKELNIDKKLVVLMIGRVIRDKGVLEYIEAAQIIGKKAYFLYVGDIDRGNKSVFVPEWKNVHYLGFRDDIKRIISVADIVVLPSYREGIPRTLLEAGAMGKPLITTDAVGCREVVRDGFNGFLVPVKDSKSLAKKINILLDDQNLRYKFGKNSREFIKKQFDVELIVEQYIKIYEKFLDL